MVSLVKVSGPQYDWTPRYDPTGNVFAWVRSELTVEPSGEEG